MKKLLLICLLGMALALCGCVEQQAPSYKYVCADSTVVDSPTQCPAAECMDCSLYCEDYCAGNGTEPTTVTAEEILQEINIANYCTTKDDCVLPATKCPLGCFNLVNKAEQADINALVREFKQVCQQTCGSLKGKECVDGKCIPILFGAG